MVVDDPGQINLKLHLSSRVLPETYVKSDIFTQFNSENKKKLERFQFIMTIRAQR